MPKVGRVSDTIAFIRGATVPGAAQNLRDPVADWLEEIAISPAIDQAMSQGTAGTELTRKYRRAMILILCALNQVPTAQAQQATARYPDAVLAATLGTMLEDVQRVAAPRRLDPVVQQLRTNSAAFLAANRIKTGRSAVTTSITTPYHLSWDFRARYYLMEPPNALHHNLHASFTGFNIAVTNFSTVQANPGQIAGAVVLGNLGLTTQLSGCSILYSVNGGNLVVAHVWPDVAAVVRANLPAALIAEAARPPGVVLALRLAHQGGLNNALPGGTVGIFGMVDQTAHLALRSVGPHNVRLHGYTDTLGNAYFVAVQVGGAWQLFGQQNNPGLPAAGVSRFQQLYP